jgi:hypothetical protein
VADIHARYSMSTYKIKIKWSEFLEHGQETRVPNSSGAYEFYVGLKEGGKTRIYVGKADDLKAVFLSHFSEDESNECLKTNLAKYKWYYRYAIIGNKADRQDAELGLYRRHSYECNKIEPPGSGRKDFVLDEDP